MPDTGQTSMPGPTANLARHLRVGRVQVVSDAHGSRIVSDRLWSRWMSAYARAAENPAEPPDSPCPGCGRIGLRPVYTSGDHLLGYASMWCPACMTGIATCRTAIPADAARLPWNMSGQERAALVADFLMVLPRYDLPAWWRWSRAAIAVLGVALAVTVVVGVAMLALGMPAAETVLDRGLPVVFFVFGTASAIRVLARWRARLAGQSDDRQEAP